MSDSKDQVTTHTASVGVTTANSPAETSKPQTAITPDVNSADGDDEESASEVAPADQLDQKKTGFLAYFKTKEFYITLSLG